MIPGVEKGIAMIENDFEIEKLAKAMAASAGVVWDQLNAYPGFERGRWRSEARLALRRIGEGRVRSIH
jgi:hypothetical protein